MLFMQAVNGGMRHSGTGTAQSASLANVDPEWTIYDTGGGWDNRVLIRDGQALYIFGKQPNPSAFGGAKTKRQFLALGKTFAASWDYCTLDDE